VRAFGSSILSGIEVSTVDGYQGQEKDVIIFSCVRSNMNKSIGFLDDSRRLNVAITRAKCSLFLLGRAANLVQSSLWRALIEDAKERGVFVPYDEGFWRQLRSSTFVPMLQPGIGKTREIEMEGKQSVLKTFSNAERR